MSSSSPSSSPLSLYSSFIRSYHHIITPAIDTCRSFALFLPGRFTASALSSEVLYSSLNIISYTNDLILNRSRPVTCEVKYNNNGETQISSLPPSPPLLRSLQRVLVFLHYTEVAMEMFAQKMAGNPPSADPLIPSPSLPSPTLFLPFIQRRHRFHNIIIFLIELTKALIRLIFLYHNKGKMLLPMSQEEYNVEAMKRRREGKMSEEGEQEDSKKKEGKEMEMEDLRGKEQRNGDNISSSSSPSNPNPYSSYDEIYSHYLDKGRGMNGNPHGNFQFSVIRNPQQEEKKNANSSSPPSFSPIIPLHYNSIHASSPSSPLSLSPPASPLLMLSEVLHIFRPLLYSSLKLYYSNEESRYEMAILRGESPVAMSLSPSVMMKSQVWRPFMISLLVDCISKIILHNASNLSPLEQMERTRRLYAMGFYLFRSPLFESFTKMKLLGIENTLGRIPLLGGIASSVIQMIIAMQPIYFYTAAS